MMKKNFNINIKNANFARKIALVPNPPNPSNPAIKATIRKKTPIMAKDMALTPKRNLVKSSILHHTK